MVAGIDQGILATQVCNQPIPVALAVVLDDQPAIRVVEIRAPDEASGRISNLSLYQRTWKARPDQLEPEPCFHRRFGSGICQSQRTPQLLDSFVARVGLHVARELRNRHQACMESHVYSND